jgi:uncharacterized protein
MHRLLKSLVILAALYVTVACTATRPPVQPVQPPAPGVTLPGAPLPASAPAVTTPIPAPPPVALAPGAEPHIALLLPLANPRLGQAAKAVQQGFLAAAGVEPGALPIRVYPCTDEPKEIAALYKQALAQGARAVVGPLTPAGVSVLASQSSIPVPTLVLNRVETQAPANLYSFGLMLENEARQAARVASLAELHTAIIVSADNGLSRRLVDAFQVEWKKLGGTVAATIVFKGDTSVFAGLPVAPGNMVFIAANADTARRFRPFLDPMLPVYATSQIFKGNNHTLINYDLRDVVFFDMPWLLQPDHALALRYPHLNPPGDVDTERLYAVGIDAYRLIRAIEDNRLQAGLPLDGVTGTITLGANHMFERAALEGEFENGMGMTLDAIDALQKANRSGARTDGPVDPAAGE